MNRFITKKRIKIYKYQMYLILLIASVFLIIFINLIMNKIVNKDFLDVIVSNSFGNIYDDYRVFSNKKNLFFKNIYGFNIENNTTVFKPNIDEVIKSEPIVYLYNTYQTDKYRKSYYNSYSISPVVMTSSLILQEYLRANNINSIVEDKSVVKVLKEHNIPYTSSYKGSRILLEDIKGKNNSLNYFFDMQIGGGNYNENIIELDDDVYARILLVVGCSNTNYKENEVLANNLNQRLEKYPNLSKGVSIRCGTGYHGVYNQDFNKNTLLFEVGGYSNTIDEVNRTMRVLASIIAEEINGTQEKN